MLQKRFVIVKQSDGKFNIQYQTKGRFSLGYGQTHHDKDYRTVSMVEWAIESEDAAKSKLMYLEDWIKWDRLPEARKSHQSIYHKYTDFDPVRDHFIDLIHRYNLHCIDDEIDQYVYMMMKDTFGEVGGWDIRKAYKLKSQFMLDMYFDGNLLKYGFYGNRFTKQEFYDKALSAITKIENMYGDQRRDEYEDFN